MIATGNTARKVILITGASSGLGLAIARAFREHRVHLVLTARESSLGRFQATEFEPGEDCWLEPLDVTNARQRERLIEKIDRELGGVDVLVNNAGISYRAVTEHVTERERLDQMEVNFLAPMALMRLCLPAMRARRSGTIINISSVSGMLSMPTMAAYSASKRASDGVSEAL